MLSVCVPVYNTDVRLLARQLALQVRETGEPVELLFFDDGSRVSFRETNRVIADMQGIVYQESGKNIGRAAIRNLLGLSAKHSWLLFIDSDSLLTDPDFLKNYIEAASGAEVVCGGTSYSPDPPDDKSILLRWVYGTKREQLTARQRIAGNKKAITANNFLIKKELFLRIGFRECIKGYGHEDTVLGYDLFKAGIKVSHIDNPVVHAGLESSSEYLEKTRKALENLIHISQNIIRDPDFQKESGLLKAGNSLKRLKLDRIAGKLFRISEPLLIRNLTGKHPSLVVFDLYRIGYLSSRGRRAFKGSSKPFGRSKVV